MVFMNCIAALTLTKKIIFLQVLSDGSVKTRPSKDKILIWKLFPSLTLSYTIAIKQKRVFLPQKKSLEGPETPEGPKW